MTPEQKEKFINGMVEVCDPIHIYKSKCPGDFGLQDFKDDMCRLCNCKECARQACEKFFKENNI